MPKPPRRHRAFPAAPIDPTILRNCPRLPWMTHSSDRRAFVCSFRITWWLLCWYMWLRDCSAILEALRSMTEERFNCTIWPRLYALQMLKLPQRWMSMNYAQHCRIPWQETPIWGHPLINQALKTLLPAASPSWTYDLDPGVPCCQWLRRTNLWLGFPLPRCPLAPPTLASWPFQLAVVLPLGPIFSCLRERDFFVMIIFVSWEWSVPLGASGSKPKEVTPVLGTDLS